MIHGIGITIGGIHIGVVGTGTIAFGGAILILIITHIIGVRMLGVIGMDIGMDTMDIPTDGIHGIIHIIIPIMAGVVHYLLLVEII